MAGRCRSGKQEVALTSLAVLLTVGLTFGAIRWWQRRKNGSTDEDAETVTDNRKRSRSTKDLTDTPKRPRHIPESPRLALRGSVPDIRATWAAKIAATDADQADPQRLGEIYQQMAARLSSQGLDLDAIKAQRQYYGGLQQAQTAFPLKYKDFPVPLEDGAVRLGIFLLADSPDLQAEVNQATRDIMATLPADTKPCSVDCANFHMTIFMTSQPSDPRPNPFVSGGGIEQSQGLPVIPAPDQATKDSELSTWELLAADTSPPQFQVHSIVFTTTGTLLLCLVDHSGHLLSLRQRVRAAFPGACEKQSSIMHMTLGRVLDGRRLTPQEVKGVQDMCQQWTKHLQSRPFTPAHLWYVHEFTFTSVEGKRYALNMRKA